MISRSTLKVSPDTYNYIFLPWVEIPKQQQEQLLYKEVK